MKSIVLFLLFLLAIPCVFAAIDFEQGITPQEEQQFDQILSPVMKVYNFIKYAATVIGVLMLVFAGVSFLTAGGEQLKKEKAKNTAVGVVIGLVLIWVSPYIVQYLFS